ncbi:MAG: site-specific DNA-methyltransferase, partial [Nitrospira sp.]|nr:site-specific DNA-methyltransferase [Nitrospira sp.]
YPAELPEYFIRMLTEPGDLVVDPFAGSCVTGKVCEQTKRRWVCIELVREYCEAAEGRFIQDRRASNNAASNPENPTNYYRVPRPGILWNDEPGGCLPRDGGRKRPAKSK